MHPLIALQTLHDCCKRRQNCLEFIVNISVISSTGDDLLNICHCLRSHLKLFNLQKKFTRPLIWCYNTHNNQLSTTNQPEGRLNMRLISWNVNGLRACLSKGFNDFFTSVDADIFCVQETKMQQGQAELPFSGYEEYWNSAVKKGYAGTAIFSRKTPQSVSYGLGIPEHDQEGRVITLEFDSFFLINVYTPNSQRGLLRLDYRLQWEDAFFAYLQRLDQQKPLIICGDANVAHQEIDIKNAQANRRNAGFTDEERGKLSILLNSGFTDTFRLLYPDKKDAYTWWSYMMNARERNIGWRIDYFLASSRLDDSVKDAIIYPDIMGSDHCPIGLEIF